MVFLTSNNTREISDALKRRCLHLYIPFPSVELEERIILSRVPDCSGFSYENQLVAFCAFITPIGFEKGTCDLRNNRLGAQLTVTACRPLGGRAGSKHPECSSQI